MLTRESKHDQDDKEFAIYRFMCDHIDIFRHKVAPLLSPNDLKRLRETCKALKFVVYSVGFSMFNESEKRAKEKVSSYTRPEQVDWAWEIWKSLPSNNVDALTEEYFCWRVAMTNSLVLLQHARDVLKLDWDWQTSASAAELGNLEMLTYCYAHDCEIDERTCIAAAAGGQLDCLKYLHETVEARWCEDTRLGALIEYSRGKHACLACFHYARDNGCPRHDEEDEYWDSDDEDVHEHDDYMESEAFREYWEEYLNEHEDYDMDTPW
jgi:hypothetical protein